MVMAAPVSPAVSGLNGTLGARVRLNLISGYS